MEEKEQSEVTASEPASEVTSDVTSTEVTE